MSTVNLFLCILASLDFLSFSLGVRLVFRTHHKVEPRMKLIGVAAIVAGVTEVWAILTSDPALSGTKAIGGFVLGASLLLFWITAYANKTRPLTLAYSHDEPTHINKRGPYRFVRHPFYTAYFWAYVGGYIASGNPWLLVVIATMGGIYYAAARFEERKFQGTSLAAEYEAYRRETGMFMPSVRKTS